jgi:hypothetical protein
MSILKSSAYALGVVAAVLFAGCSGGTQSSAFAPPSTASSTFITVMQPGAPHPDRQKSWISPDAKRATRLAFLSDLATGDIYIFALPKFTLKGTLTGFSQPQGMCSDTSGNVYVANTEATQVIEMSRTGELLKTYADSYGFPVGCAVDPTTGNLAVADISGVSGGGQVLVFPSGSHTPIVLSNPAEYSYYFVGYGPNGALWTSGRDITGAYIVSACGASACSTITLSGGTIYFPGPVQWDGVRRDWVLFDEVCGDTAAACSYPVSAKGVLGTPTRYDNYNGGGVCGMAQGVIAANQLNFVVGSDASCGSTSAAIARWHYPAGGNPTNFITLSNPYSIPGGVAISTK